MSKSAKEGASIPNWVGGVAIGVLVVALVLFGMKYVGGDGPRDPSTYPKSAYQPPYSRSDSSMSHGPSSSSRPTTTTAVPNGG